VVGTADGFFVGVETKSADTSGEFNKQMNKINIFKEILLLKTIITKPIFCYSPPDHPTSYIFNNNT